MKYAAAPGGVTSHPLDPPMRGTKRETHSHRGSERVSGWTGA